MNLVRSYNELKEKHPVGFILDMFPMMRPVHKAWKRNKKKESANKGEGKQGDNNEDNDNDSHNFLDLMVAQAVMMGDDSDKDSI